MDKFDRLWSQSVHRREEGCQICGSIEGLSAHHFIRRVISNTRYDINNGILLCVMHHTESSDFSAHKTPKLFEIWFKTKYPSLFKELKQKSQLIIPRYIAQSKIILLN